ncbi:MAG: hypothetical protein GEV03_01630 [Streptosporangiales bacterium]|nr:hypothetical protein [Streptosporangiales bacterium]
MGHSGGFRTDTDALRAYAKVLYQEGDQLAQSVTSTFEHQARLPPSAFGRGRHIALLPFDELIQAYEQARQSVVDRLDRIATTLDVSAHNLNTVAENYDRSDR